MEYTGINWDGSTFNAGHLIGCVQVEIVRRYPRIIYIKQGEEIVWKRKL